MLYYSQLHWWTQQLPTLVPTLVPPRQYGKVPSRVPLQWTKHDEMPLGCPSSG